MNMIRALILLLSLAIPVIAYSSTTSSLSYDEIKNGRGDEPKRDLTHYTTASGAVVRIGSTLRLSSPSGVGASTVGSASTVYGSNAYAVNYFKFIYNGSMGSTVWKAMLSPDPLLINAPGTMQGVEVRVQRIHLGGTKRKPYVWAECAVVNTREAGNISGIVTVWDLDLALRFGEITAD